VTKAKAQLAGNLPGGAETTTQPVIPQKEIETKEIKTDNPPITTGTYINGILTVSGVRYDMAAITAGEFLMGNNSAGAYPDEQPAHTVRIAQSFRLGKTEVTQGLWQAVMGNNPSGFPNDSTYPVERVSWDDCQAFMQKLNQMVGGNHFRLPTESEWEYACRAGTMNDPYANGDDMAWYSINSGRSTHPVGQKQAGPWGLFDMLGNVWEWCQDWYAGYSNGNQTDPPGPASGSNRVYRGGSWSSDACVVRSTYRGGDEPPGYRSWRLGFRLASD
jgi:formylglycine-generating enzyme required for sulfatase activity